MLTGIQTTWEGAVCEINSVWEIPVLVCPCLLLHRSFLLPEEPFPGYPFRDSKTSVWCPLFLGTFPDPADLFRCLSSICSCIYLHHGDNDFTVWCLTSWLKCELLKAGVIFFYFLISVSPSVWMSLCFQKERMNRWKSSSLSMTVLQLWGLSKLRDWGQMWYLWVLTTGFFTARKSSYLKMEYIFPSTYVKNSLWSFAEMDFCYFSIRTDVWSCDCEWRN